MTPTRSALNRAYDEGAADARDFIVRRQVWPLAVEPVNPHGDTYLHASWNDGFTQCMITHGNWQKKD